MSKGRLPKRVYWFRRGLVLVVALLLVFGIGKLFGGNGSDAPASSKASAAAAGTKQGTATVMGPVPVRAAPPTGGEAKPGAVPTAPLAEPNGPCLAQEISVVPFVQNAVAGGTIPIQLQLTGVNPACTFEVSPATVAVKISSGKDRIWSSQDCKAAVPTQEVVVRSGTPTLVTVNWNGQRSDDTCSPSADWALPGFYHVYAAVVGSAQTDLQFEVILPSRPVVTRTAKPKVTPPPADAPPAGEAPAAPAQTAPPAAPPVAPPAAAEPGAKKTP